MATSVVSTKKPVSITKVVLIVVVILLFIAGIAFLATRNADNSDLYVKQPPIENNDEEEVDAVEAIEPVKIEVLRFGGGIGRTFFVLLELSGDKHILLKEGDWHQLRVKMEEIFGSYGHGSQLPNFNSVAYPSGSIAFAVDISKLDLHIRYTEEIIDKETLDEEVIYVKGFEIVDKDAE